MSGKGTPGPLRLPFIGNVFHLDLGKGIFVPQQVGAGERAQVHPDLQDQAHSGYRGWEHGGSEAKVAIWVHPASLFTQLLKPAYLEPVLCSKRCHRNEKPALTGKVWGVVPPEMGSQR